MKQKNVVLSVCFLVVGVFLFLMIQGEAFADGVANGVPVPGTVNEEKGASASNTVGQEKTTTIPYAINPVEFQGVRGACEFPELKTVGDFAVYASGASSGRKLDIQIESSGHEATQFDVVVNSPSRQVVLLLGASEPSIWNIGWTKDTRIIAVLATGYYRQVVAGLPKGTPILISTHDNKGPCGYTYVKEEKLSELNPLSQRAFGKPVDMVYFASDGKAVIGAPIEHGQNLFTSNEIKPEDFVDKTKPLAGTAGLRDAVAKGILRPVTAEDLQAWADRKVKSLPKDTLPPVAGDKSAKSYKPRHVHNGYVILKSFHIPAGLYGGNLAVFFLADGVPYPEGKLGHSKLYDFNTMTCRGTGCHSD